MDNSTEVLGKQRTQCMDDVFAKPANFDSLFGPPVKYVAEAVVVARMKKKMMNMLTLMVPVMFTRMIATGRVVT